MQVITVVNERFFQLVGTKNRTRKDGSPSGLSVWRGTCRDCGQVFEVTTSANLGAISKTKSFTRIRCDACKPHRRPKATPQQGEGAAGPTTNKTQ